MRGTFIVRDTRTKEKFVVDDAYLNGYAKHCGINATGVYMVLCRHANREQEAFPAIDLIAEKLALSKSSVIRAIKKLESMGIIKVQKSRTEKGTQAPNVYVLLDKSQWNRVSQGHPDTPQPGVTQTQNRVSQGHHKVNTTYEGIKYTVDFSFEDIWKRYPNKDGRKAAEKHFHATVKTEEDWQKINRALDKYLYHLKTENWKRPKNGSTWFNNWQDWENWKEPAVNNVPLAGKEGKTPCKVCGSTDYAMILGGTCGGCRRKQNDKNNPAAVS